MDIRRTIQLYFQLIAEYSVVCPIIIIIIINIIMYLSWSWATC